PLRLIPDHQIFFEFVPVAELGASRPTRHTAADVVPGVHYAVVLTTCAGLWSYVVGDTVCFECRDPPLLRFTGRTRYGLSAFGEHLISEEIERAVAQAAEATGTAVVDFHVGPVFPDTPGVPGRHRYLVEFAPDPSDVAEFARQLDATLGRLNEDYAAHRAGDLTMLAPEVWPVPRGGFAAWMRSRGKLGGQHKLPRMDNSGKMTEELNEYFQRAAVVV
ncbi:MAG TPA: GH3 auxin-responsive promoter family protein, partial [Gemmataceae bacterium]|nr:GH3 auxin-responsive promoter family protein [Gemmataceae bacterium]